MSRPGHPKPKLNLKSLQQMFATLWCKPHKHWSPMCKSTPDQLRGVPIYIYCASLSNHFIHKKDSPDFSTLMLAGWVIRILLCAHWQPLALTSARPLSVCGMLAAIHANISLNQPLASTAAATPATAGDDRGAFCRHFAVGAASSLRKHIQNICSGVSSERRGEGG